MSIRKCGVIKCTNRTREYRGKEPYCSRCRAKHRREEGSYLTPTQQLAMRLLLTRPRRMHRKTGGDHISSMLAQRLVARGFALYGDEGVELTRLGRARAYALGLEAAAVTDEKPLTNSQTDALRMLLARPRETAPSNDARCIGGMTAKALVARGFAAPVPGRAWYPEYAVTDAGVAYAQKHGLKAFR